MKIMSKRKLNKLAVNTTPIQDQIVYRGFIGDEYSDDDVEYKFDETLVMICPRGDWKGGTTSGKIVNQKIDDKALEMLANTTEEVLVDKDHASMKDVLNRDTQAYGWAGDFIAVKDAGDFSGLYGTIKWSEEGKKLILDRSYRFLSPAFELDEEGRPVKLISIGLTNRPNFKMTPILNSESGELSANADKAETSIIEDVMTKEEIIELIRKVVCETNNTDCSTDGTINAKQSAKAVEVCENTDEETKVEEAVEEAPVEVCENTDKDVCHSDTPQNDTPVEEEEKPAETENELKEDKVDVEVIPEETLNSVVGSETAKPSVECKEVWRNLHGDALRKWMAENI